MNDMQVIAENKVSQINIIIDSSVMNAFEKCPTLMNYQYLQNYRLKGGYKGKGLDKGDLMHIPLRHYYAQKKAGVEHEKAVEFAMSKCLKYSSKFINLSDEDFKSVYTTFLSYTEFYRWDRWVILETERPFRIIIYEDPEIRIIVQGRIDLIVDTGQLILPVDHKTESRRSEVGELAEQFMLYTYAARANNFLVNKIGFQTSLKNEEKFYRVLLNYEDDNLLEWREEFVFKVREILNYGEINFFPHRLTSCHDKYGKCLFYDVCKTPRIARDMKLNSMFEVGDPWDPFHDVEAEDAKQTDNKSEVNK